jgi:putative glutamine amidotransferase
MTARVLVTLNHVVVDGRGAHRVRDEHLAALAAAGLLPVLAAGSLHEDALDALLDGCDAVYLPGGDYVPEQRTESSRESAARAAAIGLPWDPLKVRADLHVLDRAWERGLPALGVCGGFQAMVLHGGGTLRACTRVELDRHADRPQPEAVSVAGPLTGRVFAGGCDANSFHRQTVDELGPGGLTVGALSADGLVEAVEAASGRNPFWLGLQWHPERMGDERAFAALSAAVRPR